MAGSNSTPSKADWWVSLSSSDSYCTYTAVYSDTETPSSVKL